MTQTTKKTKKRFPIVDNLWGDPFKLEENRLRDVRGNRFITRARVRKIFQNPDIRLEVEVRYFRYYKNLSHIAEYRTFDKMLHIGCQEFGVRATTKIRRWALRGSR